MAELLPSHSVFTEAPQSHSPSLNSAPSAQGALLFNRELAGLEYLEVTMSGTTSWYKAKNGLNSEEDQKPKLTSFTAVQPSFCLLNS